MIAHSGGVVLSPESGSTMALIEAKDAAGAMLPGSPGTRVDSNGYAILPYLRPYRINAVEIDPKGSHDDVAFDRTVAQVVPWEGSVVKVAFGTKVQNNLTLQARREPRAVAVCGKYFLPDGKEIGVVGGQHDVYQRCERQTRDCEVERRAVFGGSGTANNKG